jgi:hypothetical protein
VGRLEKLNADGEEEIEKEQVLSPELLRGLVARATFREGGLVVRETSNP